MLGCPEPSGHRLRPTLRRAPTANAAFGKASEPAHALPRRPFCCSEHYMDKPTRSQPISRARATPEPRDFSHARRMRLGGFAVTLDGKPAVVLGVSNRFATVTTLDGSVSIDWPWKSAERIAQAGGDFRS
jgi:hypothetical protein